MPMPTDHVTRVSLSEEAYARIEAAIMDGTLEPGERLRDPDLIAWLGISRTPIRHALDRLAEQGLIEMERNRFTRVAPWDLDGVVDAVQVAGDLWAGAALRGLPRWEADDEALVREITEALRDAAAEQDNRRFATVLEHLVTTYATIEGNHARLRALANVLPQARRLGRKLRERLDAAALEDVVARLLDANRQRDGEAAARLIEAYVRRLTTLLRPEH